MGDESAAGKIEEALRSAKVPLSIDEIAERAFGRKGERERNVVRVNLHRMDSRGELVKYPHKYAIKR